MIKPILTNVDIVHFEPYITLKCARLRKAHASNNSVKKIFSCPYGTQDDIQDVNE